MEVMDTKQYLGQIGRIEKYMKNKLYEICRLKNMACSVTVSSDIEKVQSSGSKDQVGLVVSKIVDMENCYKEKIKKRDLIVSQIESIENDDLYDVLAKIYILGDPLKVVAIDKKISYKQAKRLHEKAIVVFEEKYGYLYLGQKCTKMSPDVHSDAVE